MIWTASDLSALQLESSTTCAVTEDPGAIRTLVTDLSERTAGLPTATPPRISCTPGKPVSEHADEDLLVNCRKAYWCPAAPEARSALMDSAEVRQPAVPSPGPATGLADVELGDGMGSVAGAEAGADELGFGFGFGALVVAAVLTGAGGALLDADVVTGGAAEVGGVETGSDTEFVSATLDCTGLAVLCDEVVQPAVSSRPAPSTPASRRLMNTELIPSTCNARRPAPTQWR